MRRPSTQAETVAQRWEDLKDYEKQFEERESSSDDSDHTSAKTNREKLKQLKSSANKKISSFRSIFSDIFRSMITKEERDWIERQAVSRSPAGDSQSVSSAMRNLETRIKSSRSLQNLECATAESVRTMKEKSSDLGENVKRRYGSQFNVARGKYEPIPSTDPDWEEISSPGWP